MNTPILDDRTSVTFYKNALELAGKYCEGWNVEEGENSPAEDPALVLLKIFARLSGTLAKQINEIPNKHRLAFIDFMGIDLLPAIPAKAPMTFSLAKGAKDFFIPAQTRIASSNNPEILFETMTGLNVLSATISSVYSMYPELDTYAELTEDSKGNENGFSVFGSFENGLRTEHTIYLGDSRLFSIKRATKLTILLPASYIPPKVLSLNSEKYPASEYYLFETFVSKEVPKLSIDGLENHWIPLPLSGRPKIPDEWVYSSITGIMPSNSSKTAGIDTVAPPEQLVASVSVSDIIPELAYSDETPLEVKKGFLPFGKAPSIGSTFYLACDEVLEKTDSTVTMSIVLQQSIEATTAELVWEYWNGNKWVEIESMTEIAPKRQDAVKNLKDSGKLSFICPNDIQSLEIGGIRKYWIRARITSGNYGEKGEYIDSTPIDSIITEAKYPNSSKMVAELKKEGYTFGYQYRASEYTPPFITNFFFQYEYNGKAVEEVKTFSDFTFRDVLKKGDSTASDEERPSLNLGFQQPIAGKYLSIFFPVKTVLYKEGSSEEKPKLAWEYSNGTEWLPLTVTDETDSFSRNGLVSFLVPNDASLTKNFGKELFWVRIMLDNATTAFPKLHGIHTNTVWAINSSTKTNETLGSGTGKKNLTLPFASKPILEGTVVEILEHSHPSDEEAAEIKNDGETNFRVVRNDSGEIKEVWVTWKEVTDFSLSNPMSRHYVVDHTNGTITFGDGKKGMVPQNGSNNIIAREYKSGGGSRGNLPKNTITSMKTTYPGIEGVTHHIDSYGGRDQEDVNSCIRRAPSTIKNRDRAVTLEDFEWLALEASNSVAKTRALVRKETKEVVEEASEILETITKIAVVIVPKEDKVKPEPSEELIETVKDYLHSRCLLTIRQLVLVEGPKYEEVDLVANVKPLHENEAEIVFKRVEDHVRLFLHPLKGGQKGEGWQFGEEIYLSEAAAIIEGVEGVDYVESITMKIIAGNDVRQAVLPKTTKLAISPNALPCAGKIEVKPTTT